MTCSFADLKGPLVSVAIAAFGAHLCSDTSDSSSFNGQKTKRKEISNLYSAHPSYEERREGTDSQQTRDRPETDVRKDMGKASADFVTLTSNLTTMAVVAPASSLYAHRQRGWKREGQRSCFLEMAQLLSKALSVGPF